MFISALAADNKYSLLNRGEILQRFLMQLPSELMYFQTYGFRKRWLDKCQRVLVSEDLLTSDMVNGPKHNSKLKDNTFTIFLDPCENN